jgi:hypothetical protein
MRVDFKGWVIIGHLRVTTDREYRYFLLRKPVVNSHSKLQLIQFTLEYEKFPSQL